MQKFSEDELANIRKKLEEDKKHLQARKDELTVQDPFSDPERTNDNAASDSEANEESSHDRYSALIAEIGAEIAAIDDAILRITDGTYGVCQNCGNPIESERLRVLPTATLCLTCEQNKKTPQKAK